MQYPESELVLSAPNKVYHLGVTPNDVAPTVLLVGDQDRVSMISNYFDSIRHKSQHREFVVHTGKCQGKDISVISTGIGTDNIDIVINELDALFNIDLESRTDKQQKTTLKLIRIGTCGILQPHVPIHRFILSQSAFGLDNVAHFYQIPSSKEEEKIEEELRHHLGLPSKIHPYFVSASKQLAHLLSSEQTTNGITVTSSGFYGPQGRTLRIPLSTEKMNEKLTSFLSSNQQQVMNFEMESSALFALGKALNHECITICLGIANRSRKEFSDNYQPHMERLIQYVLNRI